METKLMALPKGQVYLLGVSGGPDSMAMLDLLYQQGHNLIVAHVNYQMRPSALRDENLVKTYCNQRKIPFYTLQRVTPFKGNFQNAARTFRLQFFQKIYQEQQVSALLLAHHRNDFIETYLLKKNRQSIGEHAAIACQTQIEQMNVQRPLLDFYKSELIAYCHQHQVPYNIDETNLEERYTRNRLRLTQLDHCSPNELEALYQQALKQQQAQADFFQEVMQAYIQMVDGESLDFVKWQQQPKAIQLQVLYYYLTSHKLKGKAHVSQRFLNDVLRSLKSKKPNIVIPMGKFELVKSYEKVFFQKQEVRQDYEYKIHDTNPMLTPYFHYQAQDGLSFHVSQTDFPLLIRNARAHDRIKIQSYYSLLRRFFIDKKVPLKNRERIPIVCNCLGEIIFIPHLYKNKDRNLLHSNGFVLKLKSLT